MTSIKPPEPDELPREPVRAEPVRAELVGGLYDGKRLRVASTDRPLLLPTNPKSLTGEEPPTAPHFSQYGFDRFNPLTGYAVFSYRGDGVDAEWSPPHPELEQ